MYRFQILLLVLTGLVFSSSTSLLAQETPNVQHELGLSAGIGMSGEMDIEYYSDYILYTPHTSTAISLSYHALLFKERFNLGIGLGFQSKGSSRSANLGALNLRDGFGIWSSSDFQQAFTLPVEIGYRLKVTPKQAITMDALVIPFWSAFAQNRTDPGDTPVMTSSYEAGVNVDFGVQLGYRLQLSNRLNGQIAVRGTISPFNDTAHNGINHLSTEYYTVRLHLGLNYRFGAGL